LQKKLLEAEKYEFCHDVFLMKRSHPFFIGDKTSAAISFFVAHATLHTWTIRKQQPFACVSSNDSKVLSHIILATKYTHAVANMV
jgi:hypothetical protein